MLNADRPEAPLIEYLGGSVAFLGILGEIAWHLDDYTRDIPPSV